MTRWQSLTALTLAALTSCSTVKPWEREQLARPVMDPERNALGIAISEHLYFSREATHGGRGVGGGGCGCN
jgi:hypothetical protein